ncbi:MAG: patatin-like phospholipase family protein [Sulfuricellaceae bacterium]|nr:patatin-like phospholipase family protein [Sulfuricellaceae bacterium]
MDIQALINDSELLPRLAGLKAKQFSDIIDDEGLQYVDLVMEGGGMLGIALVGYTWALEQAGIRFLGIGGTSAGSINALLLAALDEPAKAKSPKLLAEMTSLDFFSFVDGDGDARDFIESWVAGAGKVKLAFKAMQVLDTLNEREGLNPGRVFQDWVASLLDREGIRSLAGLRARMNKLPRGLRQRDGTRLDTPALAGVRLAIVAADVSTETKVIFPDNADLYFAEPDSMNPALFVRASMSIPYFFEPLRLEPLPDGEEARARWSAVGYDAATENGGIPRYALFVDGGIMSNFPIDVFHTYSGIPAAPTFGVKLEYDKRRHPIDGPFELFGAMARHCLDYDFLHRNPEYKRLVQWIPCQGYNWLDFNMSDEHKAGLFKEGASRAAEFLEGFDWAGYKAIRAKLAEARAL